MPAFGGTPSARYPLGSAVPRTAAGRLEPDETISIEDPQLSLATLLDLPGEWPGPEKALRVRASAA